MNIDDDRPRSLAETYLASPADSWWRWDQKGQIVEWTDGRTIAFAGEIRGVLARLANRGLPSFGSVVLLMAACREGYLDPPIRRGQLFGYAKSLARSPVEEAGKVISTLLTRRLDETLKQVADGLDQVAALPADLRQSPESKALLAEVVFEAAIIYLNLPAAAVVLDWLGGPRVPQSPAGAISHDRRLQQFAAELETLQAGLSRIDADALRLRSRTGLDQLPKPAEFELPENLPPAQRVRELLSNLQSDPELAGVARLAKRLMAAVHVPRSLGAAEELPVGGVSDLANRGSFDRLLVSELAHDDLTLAVRVAMNEALYLRRESPPRRPPPRRAILLDTGIRMWGVPRLFGASVGLALAATADARGELHVCRAASEVVVPVDLTTREGLIQHLESLEPEPHPGRAAAAFVSAAGAGDGEVELIVVTHADALADEQFISQTTAAARGEWFAATVAADGSFALHVCGAMGRKQICSADLSLDDLLPRSSGATPAPLLSKEYEGKLPAIFFIQPFPVRLPYAANARYSRVSEKHGLFTVTTDGRLLQWDRHGKAALQLSASIPPGRLHDIFIEDEENLVHVVAHRGTRNRLLVISVDLDTRVETCLDVGANLPMKVWVHHGTVFLINRRDVEAITIATGRRREPVRVEGSWSTGRFFRTPTGFSALALEGAGVCLCPVPSANLSDRAVFDQLALGGPCALMPDGRIRLSEDGTFLVTTQPFSQIRSFCGVSPDGRRLAVEAATTNAYQYDHFGIDLHTRPVDWKLLPVDWREWLLGEQFAWNRQTEPMPREGFEGIFIYGGNHIGLYGSSPFGRTFFGIQFTSGNQIELAAVQAVGPIMSNARYFKPVALPEPYRFELWVVEWKDGSRAWLDSRGMLHLKSSISYLPEITLVLGTKGVAAWTSTGTCYGAEHFYDARKAPSIAMIRRQLERFAEGVS